MLRKQELGYRPLCNGKVSLLLILISICKKLFYYLDYTFDILLRKMFYNIFLGGYGYFIYSSKSGKEKGMQFYNIV